MTRALLALLALLALALVAAPLRVGLALPAHQSQAIDRIEVHFADGSVQVFVPASAPVATATPHATHTPTPSVTPPPTNTPRPSVTPLPPATYTPAPTDTFPTPTPEVGRCWGTVTASTLRVRDAVWGGILGTVTGGDILTLEARDQDAAGIWWYRIYWLPDVPGWVSGQYVDIPPEANCNFDDHAEQPPETAVLFHAVPGANRWEMEAAWSILSAAGIPFGVKSVNEPELCASAVSRGGTCIYRSLAPSDCPNVDNPDPVYEARVYMQALAPHLRQAPTATMYEVVNECLMDVAHLPWWNAFMLETLRLAGEWGWPPLVLPTYNPGAPTQEWHLDLIKPALVALRDAGGAFGMHAYSIYDDVGLCESDEWLGYRHRRVRAKLDSMGLADLDIAITEAARGGGGLPPDVADFACWVHNASEPGVHSLALWTAGTTSSWPLANLNGHMLDIARAIVG